MDVRSEPETPRREVYEDLRPLLFSIAYRIVSSVSEAEDIVQEALLRFHRAQTEGADIDSPQAWLSTVTTRLAINQVRSARARRETYVGTWLPEPLLTVPASDASMHAETADSLSMAFLVLLESLSPVERAVFLLREVFEYGYDEIAAVVGKSEENCRQILLRAHRQVEAKKPRFEASRWRREGLGVPAPDARARTDRAGTAPVRGMEGAAGRRADAVGGGQRTAGGGVSGPRWAGRPGRLPRHRRGTRPDHPRRQQSGEASSPGARGPVAPGGLIAELEVRSSLPAAGPSSGTGGDEGMSHRRVSPCLETRAPRTEEVAMKIFVCASSSQCRGSARERDKRREPMKIKLTSVYVDDQEKALRFYTEVLFFVKKADVSQGPYRWLTVASPEDPEATKLQLALNDNPAARAYQQAMFQQDQPAAMFFTDDMQADYERMKARGAEFTMPPTDVTGSKIAKLNDTCGNLIQVTQLMRW